MTPEVDPPLDRRCCAMRLSATHLAQGLQVSVPESGIIVNYLWFMVQSLDHQFSTHHLDFQVPNPGPQIPNSKP
jgi:hypothetical protein